MGQPLPLPALLSQILVAFTIEFDNEAEHRLPHRTTAHGISSPDALYAPWLISMVMYFNCLQHLGDEPISLRELERRARTPTNLHGMQRWGYIVVTNDSGDPFDFRPQPRRVGSRVQATASGEAARRTWAPLFAVVEDRWRERFGGIEIDALSDAAKAIARQLDPHLPDCMPILGYGLRNDNLVKKAARQEENVLPDIDGLPVASLLARVLLAFALEFEGESALSLAICADAIRVLNSKGIRVRDLPALSGVSKEAIAMAFGILRKARLVVVEKESRQSPWHVARLTDAGLAVQGSYPGQLAAIETNWQSQFGAAELRALREAAETIVGDTVDPNSALMQGIEPYPEGWRAAIARPRTLPHFPMVLHRGGYPDGS
jgi:hypothetical protein